MIVSWRHKGLRIFFWTWLNQRHQSGPGEAIIWRIARVEPRRDARWCQPSRLEAARSKRWNVRILVNHRDRQLACNLPFRRSGRRIGQLLGLPL